MMRRSQRLRDGTNPTIKREIADAINKVLCQVTDTYVFPVWYTSNDRHLVHKAASKAGLVHITHKFDDGNKIIVVSTPCNDDNESISVKV